MKYYEMHEIVYQRLKEEKVLSWDKSKSFDEMWKHETILYLEKFLTLKNISFRGLKVLDLGTGTGTSALFAAKEGAEVTGVEVSESALEMARQNAHTLGLEIEFIQGDALTLNLKRKFDLVIDSTILHCIVGKDDRKKFFETVASHMSSNSYFFVNTMIASGDMASRFPKEYFLFQDDVLWSKGIAQISERKTINGESYFPHRTILTLEKQLLEFKGMGFQIMQTEEVRSPDTSSSLLGLMIFTG